MQLNRIKAVDCVFALFPKGCIRFAYDVCKGVYGFISRLLQFRILLIFSGDFPGYIVIGYFKVMLHKSSVHQFLPS